MSFVTRLIAGILGGFAGGALAGIGESVVIAATSEITEYWLFLFGTASYGLIGAAIGGGWSVASGILPRLRSNEASAASSAALPAALLGLVVGRFRIIRDVFSESLALLSGTGIGVHVALLVGAAVVYLVIAGALRRSAERRGPVGATLRAAVATLVVGALCSVVANVAVGGEAQPSAVPPSTAKGPNVILIIADTLRADYVSAYDTSHVSTPAIDALAADGVVFEKAFAQSSWTRPSIATILTGLYPGSHSVMHKTDLLPDDVVTLAEAMKQGGFRTSGFVTNINVAPSFNFQQGFDEYRYLSPAFFFGATDSGSKLALYSLMRLIRERFLSQQKFVEHYYQDAHTVNEASLPWLVGHEEERFFVLIHFMDPHDPYFEIPYNGRAVARVDTPNPPPERADELRKLYASNVAYMDGFLAKLFATLKEKGLYDDTVIAFTSDHGEEFHEHGGWWHGTTLYDEEVHVPLIVKLAGKTTGGRRESSFARLLDVTPTLLAAAEFAAPPSTQGRDLFGETSAPAAVYAEEDHEGNVIESIRTGEWKLIVANEGNPRGLAPVELYDLRTDPDERVNLAAKEPDRVAELRRDLEAMAAASRASAVKGTSSALDAADEERLRALGYLE
jgi:arylsulfatase A-like enzyme